MDPENVTVKIRAACSSESEAIAEIHQRVGAVAYAHIFPGQPFPSEESVERWPSFQGQVMVAEQAGEIVGFAAFEDVELHALYVLPEYQGQGIGRQLPEVAGTVSQLWVLQENHAARRLYETRGWNVDGEERVSYGVVEVLYCRQGNAASPSGANA